MQERDAVHHAKGFAPRWLAPVMVLVLCSKPHLSIAFAVQGCRSEGGNIGGRQSMGTTCMQLLLHLPLGYSCERAT